MSSQLLWITLACILLNDTCSYAIFRNSCARMCVDMCYMKRNCRNSAYSKESSNLTVLTTDSVHLQFPYRSRKALFAALFSFILNFESVQARIPSSDDYYVGSGTVIVPPASKTLTSSPSNEIAFDESIFNTMRSSLISVKRDIQEKKWDDILARLSTTEFKALKKSMFGFKNKAAASLAFHRSAENSDIESLRQELSYSIGVIEEYSLSHRVLFFNKEDLNQIQLISDGQIADSESDREELLSVADSAIETIDLILTPNNK